MSKHFIVFLLGIFVVILPMTGFPTGWKTLFYILAGVSVSIISLLIRKEINSLYSILKGKGHTVTDSFVQSSHIDTYGKTGRVSNEGNFKSLID